MTSHPAGPTAPGAAGPCTSEAASPGERGAARLRGRSATPIPPESQGAEPDHADNSGRIVAPLAPGRATPGYRSPEPKLEPDSQDPRPRVWVDQQLCTGDGFCAKIAPEMFRMHWDGLAYVVGSDGELRTGPAETAPILPEQVRTVIASAVKCPGDCIYVLPGADGTVYGQPSPRPGPSRPSDPHP